LENIKERDHLEDKGIDGRILKWISKKDGVKLWNGFMCPMAGSCKQGDEPSGSKKGGKFFTS
jgi:hypothetical protein